MSVNLKRNFLAAATLAALVGSVAVPNVAMAAFDRPAPMQPAVPDESAGNALSGSGGVLLSDSGAPIRTGAWCDPITNACKKHAWTHHDTKDRGRGKD